MAYVRTCRNATLAGETAAAASKWADTVTARLEKLLAPHLEEGEAMPDVRLLQQLVGRLLDSRRQEVWDKDGAGVQHTISAVVARLERDQAAKELREELRHARYFLESALGKGAGARHGLGNGLSWMAPLALTHLGAETADLLESLHRRGDTPKTLASPQALAEVIRAKAKALDAALADLRPKGLHQEATLAELKAENDKAEKTIRRAAGFLRELYKLAECSSFAEQVRPVFRRKKRKRKADKAEE